MLAAMRAADPALRVARVVVLSDAATAGALLRGIEPVAGVRGVRLESHPAVSLDRLSQEAREVFRSTITVLVGSGDSDDDLRVAEEIAQAKRADGTPLFDMATSAALLVFFVLAMQCLPTLAVTRRETGSWKWPALQFAWMSAVAYLAAWVTRMAVIALGGAA
jgi:ferrous iron transport protein B